MLEGLDDVDWSTLRHAYGKASDVPRMLRALGSGDPAERERAYYKAYGNIFHQGSRYEASVASVPFLFELLADPSTPDRAELTDLIYRLALGYPDDWLPAGRDPRNLTPGVSEKWGYVDLEAYEAVESRLDVLIDIATEADDLELRKRALRTIAWFPRCHERVAPVLVDATAAQDRGLRATAALSLGYLAHHMKQPALVESLVPLVGDSDDLISFAASAGVVFLAPQLKDDAAARRVVDVALLSGEQFENVGIPWNEGRLRELAWKLIRKLELSEHLFARLADCYATSGPGERMEIATSLLLHAFGGRRADPSLTADHLSPAQQQVLNLLYRYPEPWRHGRAIYVNFVELIRSFGLPGSPEELEQWLTGPERQPLSAFQLPAAVLRPSRPPGLLARVRAFFWPP